VKTERKTENFSLKRYTQKRSTKVGGGEGAMLSPKVHTKDARAKITLLPFKIVRQNTRTYALYIYQDEKKGKYEFRF
jgi:hypothetical protein